MRSHARSIMSAVCALAMAITLAAPVAAQEGTDGATTTATTEAEFTKPGAVPTPAGGLCAPWHRCMAWAGLAMAALMGLALVAGYLVQSKGFDALEHKQGNPDGVKVTRD